MEETAERAHTLILGHAADVAGEKSSSTPALSFSVTLTCLHTSNHGSHLLSSEAVFCLCCVSLQPTRYEIGWVSQQIRVQTLVYIMVKRSNPVEQAFILGGSSLRGGFGNQECIWKVMPGNALQGRGKGDSQAKGCSGQREFMPLGSSTGSTDPSSWREGAGCLFTTFHQSSLEAAFLTFHPAMHMICNLCFFGVNSI